MKHNQTLFKSAQIGLSLIVSLFGVLSAIIPAQAAEKVVLKYSILRESVSVAELSTLANKGQASSSLKSYLKLANKRPEDLRNLLNNNVDVDPVFLSKVLNSFAGNLVLDPVGQVIQTPSKRSSRESLRGALVTSALSDKNIRVIEILENYPTSEIHVDGDRLAEIYQDIKGFISKVPRLPF